MQQRGACKVESLEGPIRMIWAEPGYHTIESDVNTDQGNFILGFMDHGTWNSAKAPMAFAG